MRIRVNLMAKYYGQKETQHFDHHADGIAINDLHAAITPRLDKFEKPVNIHFDGTGYAFLADHVVKAIRKALSHYC